MGQRTGRRAAIMAMALAFLLLSGAGIAFRGPILEAWMLRELERGGADEKREALARLASLGLPLSASRVVAIARDGGEIAKDAEAALRAWGEARPRLGPRTPRPRSARALDAREKDGIAAALASADRIVSLLARDAYPDASAARARRRLAGDEGAGEDILDGQRFFLLEDLLEGILRVLDPPDAIRAAGFFRSLHLRSR